MVACHHNDFAESSSIGIESLATKADNRHDTGGFFVSVDMVTLLMGDHAGGFGLPVAFVPVSQPAWFVRLFERGRVETTPQKRRPMSVKASKPASASIKPTRVSCNGNL